jgi:pilus assembly protein Flp/PilA
MRVSKILALASRMQEDHRQPPQRCGAPESTMFKSFLREEQGVTAIEYGLIAALIAIAIIVALTALGDALSSNFDQVSSAVTGAI